MTFAELRRKITQVSGATDPRILPAVLKRLESYRHYDLDIAQARDCRDLQEFWEDVKRQEEENLEQLELLLEERLIRESVH